MWRQTETRIEVGVTVTVVAGSGIANTALLPTVEAARTVRRSFEGIHAGGSRPDSTSVPSGCELIADRLDK